MRRFRVLLPVGLVGLAAALYAVPVPAPGAAQVGGTVVMAVGENPAVPLPAISNRTADADLADLLFLRLAQLGPTLRTAGDNATVPSLALRWRRLDPLTVHFELDPRARWQDGTPVTARDVVFTWRLATHPVAGVQRSIFEPVADVAAVGATGVRVRFKRPFNEQIYRFAYNMQPLPSHLLDGVAPESLATSGFAERPVGNGPYVLARRQGTELVELRADSSFRGGAPTIGRVLMRVVSDPRARVNLLLSGETDVLTEVQPPDAKVIAERPTLRLVRVASDLVMFATLNQRAPGDVATPHPILTDRRVREALRLALDRPTMARGVYGEGTGTPDAPQSQIWSWVTGGVVGAARDLPRAKALLAEAGWRDANGDGILDRGGAPLRLEVIYPPSAARHAFALQAQAMWREAGVDVQLTQLDRGPYLERHNAGRFDLNIVATNQDVSPSSLNQSWSCASAADAGSENKSRFCDATFDRLLRVAETAANPAVAYRAALARLGAEVPAIVFAAPLNVVAVQQRYDAVTIWPSKRWSSLWSWRVRPEAALPRDR